MPEINHSLFATQTITALPKEASQEVQHTIKERFKERINVSINYATAQVMSITCKNDDTYKVWYLWHSQEGIETKYHSTVMNVRLVEKERINPIYHVICMGVSIILPDGSSAISDTLGDYINPFIPEKTIYVDFEVITSETKDITARDYAFAVGN